MESLRFKTLACVVLLLATVSCKGETPYEPETPGTPGEIPAPPSDPIGDRKILIVYFSHTGNTRTIAGYINEAVESDIVEIKTVDTYTDDYDTLLAQIRQEVAQNYAPPISTATPEIDQYDVIFIGYPIWVETAAPPVRSFLTSHNLSGKTIVPFCTSGTSSAERSYQLIRSLCPQSTFLDGIQIRRGTYETAQERVGQWLETIGITAMTLAN